VVFLDGHQPGSEPERRHLLGTTKIALDVSWPLYELMDSYSRVEEGRGDERRTADLDKDRIIPKTIYKHMKHPYCQTIDQPPLGGVGEYLLACNSNTEDHGEILPLQQWYGSQARKDIRR